MEGTADFSMIEEALQNIKTYPELVGDSSTTVARCVKRLRDAAGSTKQKLAALEAWRQQGLLEGIDAFHPLVQELLDAPFQMTQSLAVPQTPAPQPGGQTQPLEGGQTQNQRTDDPGSAADENAAGEGQKDLQQQQQQQLQPLAPLSVEAVYDAANTYRAGIDLAPLVGNLKLRDGKFTSTVDRVRFQEEGVALMLRRETLPEALKLQVDDQTQSLQLPRSSLLFDQMGLGKTIQALALILANPRRKGQAGTLMIVPEVIVSQVMEELELHSNLRVLHYTGLAKHLMPPTDAVSSDKHRKYTELSMAALKAAHKEAQQAAAVQARARGQNAAAAAAAVEMPDFASLQQKFDELLRTPDVVVMASSDAMFETRYQAASLRGGTRSSAGSRRVHMQSPLHRLEFKRVIIDEAQQLGSTSTRLFELTTLIKAQHEMVMSGTPFPAGREATLMTSLLQFACSSSAAHAGAAAAAAAGQLTRPDPARLASLVSKAMKPCKDSAAAQEAQQALLALTSRLVIRRTLQEVVAEGFTVPQQHHHVVLVQPKYTHGLMIELLKKAAKQKLDAPADEIDARLEHALYDRLVGASSHPQFDACATGSAQVHSQDSFGAFTDPVFPLRYGIYTTVHPLDILAGIMQDGLQLDLVRKCSDLAAVARELASALSSSEHAGGPNMPEAREGVRSALDFIQSYAPMYPAGSSSCQPLSLQQLDIRRGYSDTENPTNALMVPASVNLCDPYMPYMRDVAFAGITKPRKAYEAAMVTFNSELASLKSVNRQLNAPAAAAAGPPADLGAAALEAVVPGIVVYQDKLQGAAEALQQALQDLDSRAPLQQQVQEWGGSEQQWRDIVEVTQIGLDPAQMCSWFDKLRQQREVTLQALKQLQHVPQTNHLGLLSKQDLSQYKEAFEIAHAAMKAYHECFSVVKLLKGPQLSFLRQDSAVSGRDYGLEGRMANVFDAVMLMLLEDEDLSNAVQSWKGVWQQLFAESWAADRVHDAAMHVVKAASVLAPKLLRKPAEWLQNEVDRLTQHLLELRHSTYPQVERVVHDTQELARAAASDETGPEAVELKYGSPVAAAASLLRSPDLQDKQVVVVTSNKLLYFETMHMLAYIGISHEHLDPEPWTRADGTPCSGSRQRLRSRREGLGHFRSGEARVLVLNLLDEQQAYGITLTNAHHMLVLDPVMSEPLLHQVLSRIHRYGQKQEQHVTFLTVQGSINKLLHGRFVARFARSFLDRQQGEEQKDAASPADGAAAAAAARNRNRSYSAVALPVEASLIGPPTPQQQQQRVMMSLTRRQGCKSGFVKAGSRTVEGVLLWEGILTATHRLLGHWCGALVCAGFAVH